VLRPNLVPDDGRGGHEADDRGSQARNIVGVLSGSPDRVLQWSKEAPDRFIRSVEFRLGPDQLSVDELRRLFKEGSFAVLGEVSNQYAGIAPDDPRMEPYWALAELLDVPVAIHMGEGPPGAAYLIPTGIRESPQSLLEKVGEEVSKGYQRVKLKIKPGKDLEFIAAVRKQFSDTLLSVDANSAYDLSDADHLKKLDEFNLLMIEQPLQWDDIYSHAKLQRRIKTALCLDECISHSQDAEAAIEQGACRIINIKLGRVGGHAEARRVHDTCQKYSIPVWCGGMLESGVGRAHNIALSTLPNFKLPGDVSASSR
jgi:Enolase C-terminal domain-like/Amidohydrolase